MSEGLFDADTQQPDEELLDPSEDTQEYAEDGLDTDAEITGGTDEIPDDLDELRNGYLRQQDYTKKTQELAEERKANEALKQKAEYFDRLSVDPAFRAQFMGAANATNPTVTASEAVPEEDISGLFEPQVWDALKKAINHEINTTLMPQIQPYQERLDAIDREKVAGQWETLKKSYPDAEQRAPALAEFLKRNPQSTLKQAYFAVAGEDAVVARAKALQKEQAKKRANGQLTRPGVSVKQVRQGSHKSKSVYEHMTDICKEQGLSAFNPL